MASLSVCLAIRGIWSQIWMPGTTVSIGLNWLRMPSGASGFMSHMSCCGGPPQR